MRIFCVMVFVLMLLNTSGQTRFAVKAGWDMSTARVYLNDIKQPNQYKNGFNIALQMKVPFDVNLFFTPFIAFSSRGYTYLPTTDSVSKYDNTIHYLDFVPALSYDFHTGKNLLTISMGPEISYALDGTEKTTIAGQTGSKKMPFAIDGDYGIFDLGFNWGISYHFKKVFIEAAYQLGCANINNNVDIDGRNIRNRMFCVNLGYYLK